MKNDQEYDSIFSIIIIINKKKFMEPYLLQGYV